MKRPMFFIGKYKSKVDSKGRIVLPSIFKKTLGEECLQKGLVLEKSPHGKRIVIHTVHGWEQKAQGIIQSLNEYNAEHQQYMVRMFSEAEQVSIAENGRITFSKEMLEYARINGEVVIAGQFDRIAVWAAEEFEKQKMADEQYAPMTEALLGGNSNNDNGSK